MKKMFREGERRETPREIGIRREFLEMIRSGQKTLELRVGFDSFKKLQAGQDIRFVSGDKEPVDVRVTHIREYTSLEAVIQGEDMSKLAPGMNQEQLHHAATHIFKHSDIEAHGLLIIAFTPNT